MVSLRHFTSHFLFVSLLVPVLVGGCSNSGGSSSPAPIPTVNSKPGVGNIEVIGDSLAYGTGASSAAFSPAGCFDGNFPGDVENLAVPGTTSDEIEKTLAAAISKKPKLIFISAGGNDAIHNALGLEVYPAERTLKNMGRIFDTAVASKALVVYLGINPGLQGAERLPNISAIARSKGVIVVDGMAGLWGDPKYMFDDYHPNDTGYKIMCDRIIKAVRASYP